jgi:hypothetical protein
MKVSEYIKTLQKLQRETGDVDIVIRRYSDYSFDVDSPESVQVLPRKDGEWATRWHDSMDEGDKAKLVTVIELVGGN